MWIAPIPKVALIHTVAIERFIRDGSFEEEFAPVETIRRVLIQPKTELRRSQITGEEIQIDAVLFMDCQNTPGAASIKEKSKVHFKERSWRVHSCEALYTFNPDVPHHYEVHMG